MREVVRPARGGAWVLLRRPLLLLFVIGCVVSLEASGRVSPRLVADGMVSFAFLPACQILALTAAARSRLRPMGFARLVDTFLSGNGPWLAWLIVIAAWRALESPREATAFSTPVVWTLLATVAATSLWSAAIDVRFFRQVLSSPRPLRDLFVQRTIGWSCALVYFFGYAIWPEIIGRIAP